MGVILNFREGIVAIAQSSPAVASGADYLVVVSEVEYFLMFVQEHGVVVLGQPFSVTPVKIPVPITISTRIPSESV